MKTDLDELNEFLIKVANADRVGIRVKIVAIKRYLRKLRTKSIEEQYKQLKENKNG